ncbi:MAG TPA: translation elongation factor-like protein [Candidatus Paceibacterota bacterium]
MKKKKKKKSNKKPAVKKKAAKRAAVKKTAPAKKLKPIGKVTHYYTHIKVAIVKFNTKVKAGTELYFKGATTDFTEAAKSMQFDHKSIAIAPAKKQIGIKLRKRVREGDLVYKA